jgi:hypothetical protein
MNRQDNNAKEILDIYSKTEGKTPWRELPDNGPKEAQGRPAGVSSLE